MSWQDEMVPVVRGLINDMVSPYTYSDTRLEELIVIAAKLAINEIDFDNTYTITVSTNTISPDPADNNDNGFMNLVSMKAATVIYNNEAKVASSQGFRISDGPSSIDTTSRISSALKLADYMNKEYAKAKIDYIAGNSRSGKVVMTPYTNELNSYNTHRDNY